MFAGRGDVPSRRLTKTHMEKMSSTNREGPPPEKVRKIEPSEHDGGFKFCYQIYCLFSLSKLLFSTVLCIIQVSLFEHN